MLNCMPIVTRLTLASCDGMIAPTPTIIMLSCICLFLQTLTFVTTRNDWETNAADSTLIMVREDIQKSLLPRIDQLPLDVQAIALCAVEIVIPDVAASITNQFISHAHEVCSSGLSDSAMTILVTLSNTSLVMSINRLSASMNAIGKHHSMSKPARRQAFIASILPIAVRYILIPLDKSCNAFVLGLFTSFSGNVSTSAYVFYNNRTDGKSSGHSSSFIFIDNLFIEIYLVLSHRSASIAW
jgi:hypothetical protein